MPYGMGTYGSRSLAVGGIAIVNACRKIVAKGKRVAAKMLEVSEDEIDFKDGEFVVAKSNKKKTIEHMANFPIFFAPIDDTLFVVTKPLSSIQKPAAINATNTPPI